MIHLWAQRAAEDEEKAGVVNPSSHKASSETSRPAAESNDKGVAKTNTEEPLVYDQLGDTVSSAQLIGKLAKPLNQDSKVAAERSDIDLPSEIVLPAFPMEAWTVYSSSPPQSVTKNAKCKVKLSQHQDACSSKPKLSKFGEQQLLDPVAECLRRIALFQVKINQIEQALNKTKTDLDRNEQEMTLHGEGPPNLNGDTLEDLDMRLQLTRLSQMRELAEHSEAMRSCQISLYKLCYDPEAFPSLVDAVSPEHSLRKKFCNSRSMKHRGVALAKEQRASMRDLATSPSRTW